MTIMMDHGYTLIVVLIIRTSSTTNTTMYIHPGLVANSIAIRKLMPICIRIRIRISMPLVIPTAIYHLVSGHVHDMVRGKAVVDTNTNTMDTVMGKGVVA